MTAKDQDRREEISDLLRRIVLASVGAAAVGKDELEEFVRKARAKGDLSSSDAQKLREKLAEAFKDVPDGWDDVIDASIRAALRRLNIPDRAEIARLEKTILQLTKKLESLERR